MAAIAQAALIERCFIAVAGDTTEFADWAIFARGQPFLLQCYVDLRLAVCGKTGKFELLPFR
jgi:hypothetical protein